MDRSSRRYLFSAVEKGNLDVVEFLAFTGTAITDKYLLAHPIRLGNNRMVQLLLHLGISPNSTDEAGMPLMWFAYMHCHYSVVRTFLRYGANYKDLVCQCIRDGDLENMWLLESDAIDNKVHIFCNLK